MSEADARPLELLTIGEAPPEGEETIGASLERVDELLSLADDPPEGEETIGGSLERVELLQSVASAPPEGEHTLSGDMQFVEEDSLSESLEPLRAVPMPHDFIDPTGPVPRSTPRSDPKAPLAPEVPSVAQRAPPRPRSASPSRPPRPAPPPPPVDEDEGPDDLELADPDLGDLETRDLGSLGMGPATVPLDAAEVEAAMRPVGRRRAEQPSVSRAPRQPSQGSVSDRMRRETYRPGATPVAAPQGRGPIAGTPRLATPDDLGPEDTSHYREPVLAWAATLIGLVFLTGMGALLLVMMLYLL